MNKLNKEIRDELYVRMRKMGLTIDVWARSRGIKTGVAASALYRHAGKPERPTIRQWRAREIIESLEALTGMTLCGKKLEG